MSFVTIYDLKMSGYTSSRTDLHEGCLNMLRHVYDTDDIHIQEIVRDPSFKKRQFIYPESYAVTVTFVVGRVVCREYIRVHERGGASTLDPDYVRLTTYKPKSK